MQISLLLFFLYINSAFATVPTSDLELKKLEKNVEDLNAEVFRLQTYKKNYLPSVKIFKTQLDEITSKYSFRFFDPNKKYLKCFNSFMYEYKSSSKWNECESKAKSITDTKITQLRKYYLEHLLISPQEIEKQINKLRTDISNMYRDIYSYRNSATSSEMTNSNTSTNTPVYVVETVDNKCPKTNKDSYCFTLSGLDQDWSGAYRLEDCATKKECKIGGLRCQKWDNPDTLLSCIQNLQEKKYLTANEQLMIVGLGHGAWFDLIGGSTSYNKGHVENQQFLKKLNPYAEQGIKIGFFLDSCSQGMLQASYLSGEYISTKAQQNFCLLTSSPYHFRAYGGDSLAQLKDSKNLEEAAERMASLNGSTSSGLPIVTTGLYQVLKSKGSIASFQKMFKVPAINKINEMMKMKYNNLLLNNSNSSQDVIALRFPDLIYYSIKTSNLAFANANMKFINLIASNPFNNCKDSLTEEIKQQLLSKQISNSQIDNLSFWKKYFDTLNNESRHFYMSAIPICDYLRFKAHSSCGELSSICDEMIKTAHSDDEKKTNLKPLTSNTLTKQQFFSSELFMLLSINKINTPTFAEDKTQASFEKIYFGLNNSNDAFQNYMASFWALIHDSIIKNHGKELFSQEEEIRAKACAQINL